MLMGSRDEGQTITKDQYVAFMKIIDNPEKLAEA